MTRVGAAFVVLASVSACSFRADSVEGAAGRLDAASGDATGPGQPDAPSDPPVLVTCIDAWRAGTPVIGPPVQIAELMLNKGLFKRIRAA